MKCRGEGSTPIQLLVLLCVAHSSWFISAQKTANVADGSMSTGADIMRREKKTSRKHPAALVATGKTSQYRQTRKAIHELEKQVRQNQQRALDLQELMDSLREKDPMPASLVEEETFSNDKGTLSDRLDKLNRTSAKSACHAFQTDDTNKILRLEKGRSLHIYKTGQPGDPGGNLIVGVGHNYHVHCSNSFIAGFTNSCNGDSQVVLGGMNNQAGHTHPGVSNMGATVMGGNNDKALKDYATVVGGYGNEASSEYGAILGGFNNKLKCLSSSFRPVLLGGTEVLVESDTWVAPDNPCSHR